MRRRAISSKVLCKTTAKNSVLLIAGALFRCFLRAASCVRAEMLTPLGSYVELKAQYIIAATRH